MKRKSFKASGMISFWCGVLLFITCCSNIMAQSSTSSVSGTVVDPQGNLVAGATVTLSNDQKNFTRTQSSTEGGSFAFTLIPPGQYRVEAEATGFKKAVLTNVGAQVAKATTLTIQLEVGSVQEVVTVSSGAGEVLVNRQDGTLGNNFINQQITQL
ncbi:MAG TPA: carboxypeptidase-like regulatory domain-containing protein, partial [Pyrinomonadaceae bacterium]|nr:carboxypeptidase-like regulatory domain-containing protein [Pyrinomonadaceae bacterium]